jgi:hypothetical protein
MFGAIAIIFFFWNREQQGEDVRDLRTRALV